MNAKLYYDRDADLTFLEGKTMAVIGFGSQGHAHALNLRDSGLQVVVGLPSQSSSRSAALNSGLETLTPDEASGRADLVALLTPDAVQPQVFQEDIRPRLRPGSTLLFAHGFNIRFGQIEPPQEVDVVLAAPKTPGHRMRELFVQGQGTPALAAVEQDATGQAWERTLAYSKAIGCTRAGVLKTTFAEETETDLFGEQAVLCGGVSALIRSGFETLVEAGYQPELAYFECLHELKLIVDLIYEGGLSDMWWSVSDTAEHGGYEGGERIIDERTRLRMRAILDDIRNGDYAQRCLAAMREPAQFRRRREWERNHDIEAVGRRLRSMMGFLAKGQEREKLQRVNPQDEEIPSDLGPGSEFPGALREAVRD